MPIMSAAKDMLINWLLKDEMKAIDTGSPMVTTGAASLAPYTEKTVSNFAKYGYMNNITVFRAVKVLAEACASIDWQVFSKGSRREEIPDHPIAKLLSEPNLKQSRGEFFIELVSYKLIAGTNYLMGSFPGGARQPLGLYNLRPDLVQPLENDGVQTGWKYNTGSQIINYPLWKVKPIKFFHPLDPLHGLSPIQVAASVIERQNSGEEWNFSLMRNMARPSGAFVAPTDLSDTARSRLKAEVIKKYGRGFKTAGMPMLLENGLQYLQLALSPIDTDWFNSDASAGRKIAAAIGVDPLLLNDKQYSTYNNSTEAKLALWELSGFPIMDTLRDDLNIWLVKFWGTGVEVDYNRRPIEALKRNRQLESVTTVAEWNNGVRSFNDTATELGLDAPLQEKDDFYRFGPAVFVRKADLPIWIEQQSQSRQANHEAAMAQAQQATQVPTVQVSQIDNTPPKLLPSGGNKKPLQIGRKSLTDDHDRLYQELEKQREGWYGHMEQAIIGYFHSEELMLKAAFKREMTASQIKATVLATQAQYADNLSTIFATYYASIAESAARNVWRQFETGSKSLQKETTSILAEHVSKDLSYINNTTQQDIAAAIQKAETYQGIDTVMAIQMELSQLYEKYKGARATGIAINEVVLAYNLGSHIAARNMGVPLKKTWISARDSLVRQDHILADGQQKDLEGLYTVGGSLLLFPKDETHGAAASETVNCRCGEYYSHNYGV